MMQRYFARIAETNVLTTPGDVERIQEAVRLSPQEIEQEIIRAWNALQEVPSYVERQLEANRGLIESIATQH